MSTHSPEDKKLLDGLYTPIITHQAERVRLAYENRELLEDETFYYAVSHVADQEYNPAEFEALTPTVQVMNKRLREMGFDIDEALTRADAAGATTPNGGFDDGE